jgi:hypothetical protein
VTETVAVPGFAVPLFTEIVADPAATAVTRPLDDTVATAALELDHTNVALVKVTPRELTALAESWTVLPATRLLDDGVTVIVAALPGCREYEAAASGLMPAVGSTTSAQAEMTTRAAIDAAAVNCLCRCMAVSPLSR